MKRGSLLLTLVIGFSAIIMANHARSANPIHPASFVVLADTLSYTTELTGPLTYSPDGKWLACGSGDRDIALWDLSQRHLTHIIHPPAIFHYSATFSPDSKILATGGHDRNVMLWDVKTGKLVKTLQGAEYGNRIYRMAFTPDGKTLMAATYHGILEFWNVRSGERKEDMRAWRAWDLSLSPSGRSVAVVRDYNAGGDAIDIYNVQTNRLRKSIVVHNAPAAIADTQRVSYSPDAKLLATAGTDIIALWDSQTGRLKKTIPVPEIDIAGWLYFQPDGKTLLTARSDGRIDLLSVSTGKVIKEINVHQELDGLAVSPKGTTVAAAYKGVVHLYSLRKWPRQK